MDAMAFGDKYTTSGGKAIGFHSSVRLRIKSMGKITAMVNGVKTVVGMKTQVVVAKNRMGPPHKAINYNIYFDSGIDNVDGWVNVLKMYGIISGTAAKFTYTRKNGDKVEFKPATFQEIVLDNPDVKEEIYDVLCEKFIMKYNPRNGGDIEVVGVEDDEELMTSIADGLSADIDYNTESDMRENGGIKPNTDFMNEKSDEE
jgi:recombination protein RecA